MIEHIVAIDSKGGFAKFGDDGKLGIPWKLPIDKEHYRAYIAGKNLLMGHATYRPRLEAAFSFVLTNAADRKIEKGVAVNSIEEALRINNGRDLVVIGGESVYVPTISLAQRLIVTHVEHDFGCDRFYPPIWDDEFEVVQESDMMHDNGLNFRFVTYERILGGAALS